MKKIIMILMCMCVMPACATSMCVPDDVFSIVLDPTIAGKTAGGLDSFKLWKTVFPYGTITGTSACLSANMGTVLPDGATDNGELIVGGERNGGMCYCKMLHPLVSRWVFSSSWDEARCASVCASRCYGVPSNPYGMNGSQAFRVSVFGTID